MSEAKYSAKAPTVEELFDSLVGKALRHHSGDLLDAAIDICLDVEKLGGHALDCATALSSFKRRLNRNTAPMKSFEANRKGDGRDLITIESEKAKNESLKVIEDPRLDVNAT